MKDRMKEGLNLAEQFRAEPRFAFSALRPSDLPVEPGVYAIFLTDTDEALYVGRTKNLRQRLYKNHLHGSINNARLKKYLAEDANVSEVPDFDSAKQYLKENCYCQFIVEPDMLARGRLEGLLSYLFKVRYMYEEH